MTSRWDVIFQIATIVISLVPAYFLLSSSPAEVTLQALVFFGFIVGLMSMGIIFTSIYQNWKKMRNDIDGVKQEINEIRASLNLKQITDSMNVRLQVVETLLKKKKGQMGIDPRIIIFIFLLILLYLFLRSIGIVK